ncbi:MAG: ferric reductase-like transmembrane domain-containing protein [Methanosarcina sp.]
MKRNDSEKRDSSTRNTSGKIKADKQAFLVYGVILIISISIMYVLLQTPANPLRMLTRFAATFGYLAIFLAILSSECMSRMKKLSGFPFLKAHHHLARIGILLILAHPVLLILDGQSFRIFLPVLHSAGQFLATGGRPALYLFLLATSIAIYRRKYKNWKKIHYLHYPAFLLVSAHALLIGTDFTSNIMRLLAFAMSLAVIGIFVNKRAAKKRKAIKSRK